MGECCLTSSEQFSAIWWQEQVTFLYDDDVCFVLDQHTELAFYSASSLKQQSSGRHVDHLNILFYYSKERSIYLWFYFTCDI